MASSYGSSCHRDTYRYYFCQRFMETAGFIVTMSQGVNLGGMFALSWCVGAL